MLGKLKTIFLGLRREWRITAIASLLSLLILFILLAFIPLKLWLWSGWLYGAFVGIVGYSIGIKIAHFALRTKRAKSTAIFLGSLRAFINFIFHIVFLLLLIFIDNIYFDHQFFSGNLNDLVDGPLNFFTYLAGISIIIISIGVNEIIHAQKNRKQ